MCLYAIYGKMNCLSTFAELFNKTFIALTNIPTLRTFVKIFQNTNDYIY